MCHVANCNKRTCTVCTWTSIGSMHPKFRDHIINFTIVQYRECIYYATCKDKNLAYIGDFCCLSSQTANKIWYKTILYISGRSQFVDNYWSLTADIVLSTWELIRFNLSIHQTSLLWNIYKCQTWQNQFIIDYNIFCLCYWCGDQQ